MAATGSGTPVVYCVRETGGMESSGENGEMQVLAGLAGGHGLGRFACDSPAGLAGLPSKAHYKTANACRCPLDFFFAGRPSGLAGGPAPIYIPMCTKGA
jgi:hypothetical protein